jgi:hypothetical protein
MHTMLYGIIIGIAVAFIIIIKLTETSALLQHQLPAYLRDDVHENDDHL